jgi:hypothetical protein
MRSISRLCSQLPTLDPGTLARQLQRENVDALMMVLLPMVTSGTSAAYALINKQNEVAHDRAGLGKRPKGLSFLTGSHFL